MSGRSMKYRRMGVRLIKIGLPLLAVALGIYFLMLAPVDVQRHEVQRGPIVQHVMGTGTLGSRTDADIAAEIGVPIRRVHVDEGDRVRQGQLLIELDDRELLQQIEMARASVEVAQAAMPRLEAERRRAQAVVRQAQLEHDRLEQLLQANSANRIEYERAAEVLAVAEAELARAQAAIVEGQQQIAAAQASLAYQRTRLENARIEAPFDGMIIDRLRDPGDMAAPGTPILRMIADDPLWISAWVDETQLPRLAVGQDAQVIFRSEPESSYEGRVVRIGRAVDRETRELVVDVEVLHLPGNWAVGQRADVYIRTAQKQEALVTPADLVRWRHGEPGLLAAEDGRIAWRPIEIGLRGRDRIEVLRGVEAGEVVLEPRDQRGVEAIMGRRIH